MPMRWPVVGVLQCRGIFKQRSKHVVFKQLNERFWHSNTNLISIKNTCLLITRFVRYVCILNALCLRGRTTHVPARAMCVLYGNGSEPQTRVIITIIFIIFWTRDKVPGVYYYYYLTLILNSQGRKIMLCKDKIQKQAGMVFTLPLPSRNYPEVE